jgi:hypothetical protein
MTLLFIIFLVFIALCAIAAYQLVINRYYWGPKGPPKKEEHKPKDKENP